MPKITINVLASDFENNSYLNVDNGKYGCPLTRAFYRADFLSWYQDIPAFLDIDDGSSSKRHSIEQKVCDMFDRKIPIEDFSFDIEIPD